MRVAVIGGGTMGNGIAHVFAQHGHDVVLVEAARERLDRALGTIRANLERQVKKGALTADAAAARLADTAFRGDWVCLLDAPLDATFPPAPTDYSPGTTPGRWDAACFVEEVSPE